MLVSVDGKISTGDTDSMDFDRDLKTLVGTKEGLHQYYELEKQTDLVSLNTGRVMAKIGINERTAEPKKIPVSFVIIDNEPHLTAQGIEYLSKWVTTLYLVTTNKSHPAYSSTRENIKILIYNDFIDLPDLFHRLREEFDIKSITVQSGGTLNATLIHNGLIDHLSVVIAPVIIGGEATPSLMMGESLHSIDELNTLKALKLFKASVLDDSYLHLQYDLLNS